MSGVRRGWTQVKELCDERLVTSRDGRMSLNYEQKGLDPGKRLLGEGQVTSRDGRICLECEQGLDPGNELCDERLVTSEMVGCAWNASRGWTQVMTVG